MKKAVFILGPTGVGKTRLAEKIAKVFPSVLISADSVQVYKGLDIISGKDHLQSTKIELIDIVSPSESFTVKDFITLVNPVIKGAVLKGKIPVVVGGTGFYADALFNSIDTLNIPPNEELRKSLENKTVEDLQAELERINPERLLQMNESDARNKRRLIRAIETSRHNIHKQPAVFKEDDVLFIGLLASMDEIEDRIKVRVAERLDEGALDEAKTLSADYKHLSPQVKNAIGYKQLFTYLSGLISFEEAKKAWIDAEIRLVKKQMTWFRKNKKITWFDIREKDIEKKVIHLVEVAVDNNKI